MTILSKAFRATAGLLTAGLLCSTATAAEEWRTTGFSTPESALFDSANNRIIVSNIVGDAMQADGNGTLSTVAPDGTVIEAEWVTGLDSPKGSAIGGDKLYVADLTKLRIVDLASGEYETVDVPGSVFLNDVTVAEDGTVYVTDTFGNSIYSYKDGTAALFVQDAALDGPNGILAVGPILYIASAGVFPSANDPGKPGGVQKVDIATKAVTKEDAAGDFGTLDGIVMIGNALYLTDFMGGKLFRLEPGGTPTEVATLKMGSADAGSDGTSIYVPQMMEGELVKITP
jgi:sugar lactone lactonase YvrE